MDNTEEIITPEESRLTAIHILEQTIRCLKHEGPPPEWNNCDAIQLITDTIGISYGR